jgi:hypothetical protein
MRMPHIKNIQLRGNTATQYHTESTGLFSGRAFNSCTIAFAFASLSAMFAMFRPGAGLRRPGFYSVDLGSEHGTCPAFALRHSTSAIGGRRKTRSKEALVKMVGISWDVVLDQAIKPLRVPTVAARESVAFTSSSD